MNHRSMLLSAGFCAALLQAPGAQAAGADPAQGGAANSVFQWDLSDLYPSPEAWAAERERVQARVARLDQHAGTLGRDAATMLQALEAISGATKEAYRLYEYASLRGDEDVRVAANQERRQAAQSLMVLLSAKTAWLAPEVIALGPDKVGAYLRESAELRRRFDFQLGNMLRSRAHTLGTEAEGVMSQAGDVLAQPDKVFQQLVAGELPWATVRLSTGEDVKIDVAGYEKHRQSTHREDRARVFAAFFSSLAKFQGTIGATLNTQVLAEEFDARVRHHPNALADAIFSDNMPEAVYRTLVAEANAGLPVLHRYLRLRKAALGIADELRYHDLYPPMYPQKAVLHYGIDEMKRISLAVARENYGPEYAGLLEKGFAGRWMDFYPREGKYTGAYMAGWAYDVHPYLLFNNHDDFEALTTFLHEWGHAVHTMLASRSQPFEKSNYSTFIAETASIGNEMVLSDYLLAHAANDEERLFLLVTDVERIRKTFFRQVMFAEFQLAIHEEVEKGGSLSGKRISDLYCGVVRRYYGEEQGVTKIDPEYCIEWAYVSHFYYGFYVYQYATSMVGAALLSDAIEHEGAPARARFLDLLKAGGSDYPYDLYRKAGIDMATAAPYRALVARMSRDLDRIEALQKH